MESDAYVAIGNLVDHIGRVLLGKEQTVRLAVTALLAQGHLLIEDAPGVGKTSLAKALAMSLNCKFTRLQFTPDLLPSDILGTTIFLPNTGEFEFRAGPIFTNILLADEINRTTPRTQSALAGGHERVAGLHRRRNILAPRFLCWRHKIHTNSRERIPCPRISWIASCSVSKSAIPP
ncbi:MAG: AAA family ATPase [Planctomycetaceae bacterium]